MENIIFMKPTWAHPDYEYTTTNLRGEPQDLRVDQGFKIKGMNDVVKHLKSLPQNERLDYYDCGNKTIVSVVPPYREDSGDMSVADFLARVPA